MQSVHYHSSLEPLLDTLPFYTRYIFTLPPYFCKGTRPFQLLTSILAFRTPKKGHSTRTPPQQNTYFPSPLPTPPTLSIKSQLSKFPSSYLAFTLFPKQKETNTISSVPPNPQTPKNFGCPDHIRKQEMSLSDDRRTRVRRWTSAVFDSLSELLLVRVRRAGVWLVGVAGVGRWMSGVS
jgi:hypothetical protein